MAQPQAVGTDTDTDRQDKLFYSTNTLHLLEDFLQIFHPFLNNTQIFNQVVQGTPIPQHRIHFFIERINRPVHIKWTLFFKHLLKFYNLHQIADLLYQGFYYAGLKEQYKTLAVKEGNYFLWPKGETIVNPYCELPGPGPLL